MSELTPFLQQVKQSLHTNSFIKLTLANYTGTEADLKNVYVRLVEIKREHKLSFTFRYKTRDIVKNYFYEEGLVVLKDQIEAGFNSLTLFTAQNDVLFLLRNRKWTVRLVPATMQVPGVKAHDKSKARKIETLNKQYLVDLKLTDVHGKVFQNAQDKYKQVNQYIEILNPVIKELPEGSLKHIVDMGSGKGYLTFALYDYLKNFLNQQVQVTGVEYRQDMVDLCNQIARNSNFSGLGFVQGTIEDFEAPNIDMLIALHACDTATDDAIYKGIKAGAKLIVTAPCCHKQIRKEMVKGKRSNALDFLTEHGIFLERQAEMVTDGIRALVMEYFGYKTKIMQFISDAHTPKNVLIVGRRQEVSAAQQEEILNKIKSTKAFFGIGYHHLERIAGLV